MVVPAGHAHGSGPEKRETQEKQAGRGRRGRREKGGMEGARRERNPGRRAQAATTNGAAYLLQHRFSLRNKGRGLVFLHPGHTRAPVRGRGHGSRRLRVGNHPADGVIGRRRGAVHSAVCRASAGARGARALCGGGQRKYVFRTTQGELLDRRVRVRARTLRRLLPLQSRLRRGLVDRPALVVRDRRVRARRQVIRLPLASGLLLLRRRLRRRMLVLLRAGVRVRVDRLCPRPAAVAPSRFRGRVVPNCWLAQ